MFLYHTRTGLPLFSWNNFPGLFQGIFSCYSMTDNLSRHHPSRRPGGKHAQKQFLYFSQSSFWFHSESNIKRLYLDRSREALWLNVAHWRRLVVVCVCFHCIVVCVCVCVCVLCVHHVYRQLLWMFGFIIHIGIYWIINERRDWCYEHMLQPTPILNNCFIFLYFCFLLFPFQLASRCGGDEGQRGGKYDYLLG